MKPARVAWILLLLAAMGSPRVAHGASATAGPAKDNTLYAESDTLSNGAGQRLFAGKSGTGHTRRALVVFDLAGVLPSGATVDSVVLQLNLAQTSPGTRNVSLHRVRADWGEGTSAGSGGEGGGASATAGDATWGQRFFGAAQPWTTPGGDYHPGASASRPVGAVGVYTWRSAAMTADVVSWLESPSSNFGWELVGNETDVSSAKAFNSRQAGVGSTRPMLTIYYTKAPTGAGPFPPAARLFPVHPNPFNPSATIRYHVAASTRVHLAVYDVRGRRLLVLVDDVVAAGTHEVVWRGVDARGLRVASGVYLARLRVEGAPDQATGMVLVK